MQLPLTTVFQHRGLEPQHILLRPNVGFPRCPGAKTAMKILFVAILGLLLGALGGAALGLGAGLAWVEIFKTSSFEGYSGMLVFFTFLPLGALIGGLGGAILFGVTAARDAQVPVTREPIESRTGS